MKGITRGGPFPRIARQLLEARQTVKAVRVGTIAKGIEWSHSGSEVTCAELGACFSAVGRVEHTRIGLGCDVVVEVEDIAGVVAALDVT
jgi:hypothetical protein